MSHNPIGPWTERDLDILRTLALRVRLLTLEHLAGIWWADSRRGVNTARARMRKLTRAGFLHRYLMNVHPLLPLQRPAFVWHPGKRGPNEEKLSHQFRKRWTQVARPTSVFLATRRTVNLFGGYGKGRLGNPLEWDHDLHVGQVYCCYRKKKPREASLWLGEDAYPKAGFGLKDPDAFLRLPSGERARAIEFAGKYDAQRVRDFHLHCQTYEMPYELW